MDIGDWRAIEALRAGVPNGSAVTRLDTDQTEIEGRFLELLSQVASERELGHQIQGFLIHGDFGSGKSHLLGWLEHVCLRQGFACSRIAVGKETPLGDGHKLFRAAMDALRLPDRAGGLREVADRLRPGDEPYARLYRWVQDPGSGFDPLFQATLFVFERMHVHGMEEVERIVGFWAGDRINVTDLKRWVRELGQTRFDVRARPARELVLPRWRFAAGLIAAAGYTGWVLLLDEVELVATFSAVARARAYAVLAMLVGALEAKPIPGLFTVGAVSPDLTQVVFEQRGDREKVPLRWGGRDPALLAEIEAGMAFLDPRSQAWLRIREPRPEALLRTYQRVRELYGLAYEWPPPEEMPSGDRHRIRQHVRRWITRWDLMRLFPDERPEVVTQDLRFDYSERPEMEAAEEDGQAD
jgi:hypothetical protein